jgi:hypothetical protein
VRILIAVLMCWSCFAQLPDAVGVSQSFTPVSSLPATCVVGQSVILTTATAGINLYVCTATNTWSVQPSGPISITGAITATGAITSGSGSGVGGALDMAQGTLPALGTNAITLMAPTAVTSYGLKYPGAAPSAGQSLVFGSPLSGISTGTFTTVLTAYRPLTQTDYHSYPSGPGGRANGTIYQNTTGYPMWVYTAIGNQGTAAGFIDAWTDQFSTPTTPICFNYMPAGGQATSCSFLVMPGNYYQISLSSVGGGAQIFAWMESY